MGSLKGHLLPGSFFIGFGFWWTYALFDRYFQVIIESALTKTSKSFKCTASYTTFESYIKIIASIIGVICEYTTALDGNLSFINIGNSQHITMYLFFLINGIVELLVHYNYPLPKGSDYMSLMMALIVEAFLFSFHLDGRTSLDIHVHTLLIVSVIASVVSIAIEWKHRYHVLSAFCRALCTLIQGFWFYTIGFILYPPWSTKAPQQDHRRHMLLTAMFCWQIIGILVLMSLIGYCVYYKYRQILWDNKIQTYSDSDEQYISKNTKTKHLYPKECQSNQTNGFNYLSICTSDEEL